MIKGCRGRHAAATELSTPRHAHHKPYFSVPAGQHVCCVGRFEGPGLLEALVLCKSMVACLQAEPTGTKTLRPQAYRSSHHPCGRRSSCCARIINKCNPHDRRSAQSTGPQHLLQYLRCSYTSRQYSPLTLPAPTAETLAQGAAGQCVGSTDMPDTQNDRLGPRAFPNGAGGKD